MAFHKLPPIEDFVAARLSRDFEARSTFEAKAYALFLAYLVRRGTTPEALVRAHEDNFKQAARALEQRDPPDIEISDLRALGLVLAGLAALRVVKSGAATVETHKYCVPLEDLGKRRCWANVLPRR